MLFSDEEKDEMRESTRHLKGWRVLASVPFLILSLVLMGLVWCILRVVYFVAHTTVQVQGFDNENNKRFHRFAAWVKGNCYDCEQIREIDNLVYRDGGDDGGDDYDDDDEMT